MTKLVRKTLADSPLTPGRKRKLAHLAERPERLSDQAKQSAPGSDAGRHQEERLKWRPVVGQANWPSCRRSARERQFSFGER